MSDTITVYAPSLRLPDFYDLSVREESGVAVVEWRYNERIDDLQGFNLYQNGEIIASSTQIGTGERVWRSVVLPAGMYTFQMEAVSRFGKVSKKTSKRNLKIGG